MMIVQFNLASGGIININVASIVAWTYVPGDTGETPAYFLELANNSSYTVKEDPQEILTALARQMALGGGIPQGGIRS